VITARDRRIISALIPLLLVAAYWFVVLAPKRAESDKVNQELTKAQGARDTAEQQVAQLNAAKASFASDYATVLRLGKAVPTTVDMPSLLVQLDSAASGTGVRIGDFKPGTPTSSSSSSTGSSPTAANGSTPPGGGNNPAAPGAPPAQGFPAKQAQKAGKAVTQANGVNQANADKANGVQPSAPSSGSSVPGLVSIPLTFTMSGNYFNLADFLHRMKRFVQVVNDQIVVNGRLMTIESFSFQDNGTKTTALKADVSATIYLTPPDQGTTAGATPQGPAGAPGSASTPTGPNGSASPPTPTATATP
jgi:Tfp pilus assembly protein PilO